jgi:hypothetical protein
MAVKEKQTRLPEQLRVLSCGQNGRIPAAEMLKSAPRFSLASIDVVKDPVAAWF